MRADWPRVETLRLVLRGHRLEDYAASYAMWADPDVTRYIGGKPSSAEEVWARMLRYAGLWHMLGYGYWVISEKSSGNFIGEIGFADFKRDILPALDVPEIGWALIPTAHGKGFATEAVQAALGWGTVHLPAPTTRCIIDPANQASCRVAEKCGFQQIGTALYKASQINLYEAALLESFI